MSSWDADDLYTCPICSSPDCVPPSGKKTSPILFIGEQPGRDEIAKGKPFCGATGGVLKAELAMLGIDLAQIRLCNLWLHVPIKCGSAKKDKEIREKNAKCFEHSLKIVMQEAKGKKLILLIGSESVKYFTKENVSAVSGLKVTSSLLSAPVIMACIQPATVFHGTIGELRLSLQKFTREAKKIT